MKHLQQLKYIDAVARSGSIRRAAETMAITSTALNRRILAVEDDLGTPIFERLPNGVRLSVAGELFIQHVRQQLSDMERVQSQIADLSGERRGHVAVVCGQALMQAFIPAVIARYRAMHPAVTFSVFTAGRQQAAERLIDFSADVAMVFEPEASPGVQVLLEVRQQLHALVAADHPLAAQKSCRLSECSEYSLALPSYRAGIRHLLEKSSAQRNVTIRPTMESDNAELLLNCVRHENMVAFQIPVAFAMNSRSDGIATVPVNEKDVPSGALQVCQQRGRVLPVAAARFAGFVTNGLSELDELFAPGSDPDEREKLRASEILA